MFLVGLAMILRPVYFTEEPPCTGVYLRVTAKSPSGWVLKFVHDGDCERADTARTRYLLTSDIQQAPRMVGNVSDLDGTNGISFRNLVSSPDTLDWGDQFVINATVASPGDWFGLRLPSGYLALTGGNPWVRLD